MDESGSTGARTQGWAWKALGFASIAAGAIWFALFPKKDSWEPDMVGSVCIGVGLVGSGALLVAWRRMRRVTAVLLFVLLWSALGNVHLYSLNESFAGLLRAQARPGEEQADSKPDHP